MEWFKNWKESRKKKEIEQEFINRREGSLYNLLVGIDTEDSIRLFEEVSSLFHGALKKRLDRLTEEKSNIEKFLEDGKNI